MPERIVQAVATIKNQDTLVRRADRRAVPPTAHTREPVRPPTRRQVLLAGLFGGELTLKLGETLVGKDGRYTPIHYI